jgi:hypothetical protein
MSVQRPVVARTDVHLPAIFGQGPRTLRRSWMLATVLGEAVGFLVPALVAVVAFDLHPALNLCLMVVAGSVEGLLLGAAQSLVLGREFLGFSRASWVGATALGASAAWFLGMLPSTLHDLWSRWPLPATVATGTVLGVALLATIGLAQYAVLRRHVARARTWPPVVAVAWLVGLGAFMGITTPLWREGQGAELVIAIGALGGLAMAVTVAAVTGLWLVRLVYPPPGKAASRPAPAGVPARDWAALSDATDRFRVFDPGLVEDLPEPVQRWLLHAITPGSALLTGLDVECTGHLRLGRSWRAFCSRQRSTLAQGFVWSARTRMAGLPVTGFDRFTRGEAEMRWRLLHRLRLVAATGSEVTRSSAGRHAAELLATDPAVALDPAVMWEPVDHQRAAAHLVVGGELQVVTVSVDLLGRLRQVEMDRWGTPPGSKYGKYRFGAVLTEERRFDGYLLPTEVVAGWHIGTGRWDEGVFLRSRIVRCSFH